MPAQPIGTYSFPEAGRTLQAQTYPTMTPAQRDAVLKDWAESAVRYGDVQDEHARALVRVENAEDRWNLVSCAWLDATGQEIGTTKKLAYAGALEDLVETYLKPTGEFVEEVAQDVKETAEKAVKFSVDFLPLLAVVAGLYFVAKLKGGTT